MFFSYFPIFLFPYLQQIHFEIIICFDKELQSKPYVFRYPRSSGEDFLLP